ncbi:MAG: hypothetical protein ACLVJH_07515 [Faecalibacterium prausnitzii]
MSKQGDAAYAWFLQGYNCSQSVVAAFAPQLGLTEENSAAPFRRLWRRYWPDAGGVRGVLRCGDRAEHGLRRPHRPQG